MKEEILQPLKRALECIRHLQDGQGSYQTAWVSDYTKPIRELIAKIEGTEDKPSKFKQLTFDYEHTASAGGIQE